MRIVDLEKHEPTPAAIRWAKQYADLFREFGLRPVGYDFELKDTKYNEQFIYALSRMYTAWKAQNE